MIIYHNMKAMNTHRMLGINASTLGKSTEKLSSGLRVNRAADDAAGLSISEKMRGQIRGLTQASRNAQDGISVVQTAEGALDEVHSILQRMRELSVQSANDSNVQADRAAIQQEVSQLTDELDRISGTTQFNTMNLLDGTFQGKIFHIGANQDQNLSVDIENISAQGLGLRMTDKAFADVRKDLIKSIKGQAKSVAGLKGKIASVQSQIDTKLAKTMNKIKASIDALRGEVGNKVAQGLDKSAAQVESKIAIKNASLESKKASIAAFKKSIQNMRVLNGEKSLDYKSKNLDQLNARLASKGGVLVNTQKAANRAITTINDALTIVSTQRSKLGAIQNRMEHTIKNLDNAAENLQAAESRIRDTDMAKEMSEFTKKNILTQASQAMLAQANQLPAQVLQLLR